MFRKFMLAGLMTATILGGAAPAYAQNREDRRDQRSARDDRPAGQWAGQWRGQRGQGAIQQDQRQQQRDNDRPVAQVAPARTTEMAPYRPEQRPVGPVVTRPDRREWPNGRGDMRQQARQDIRQYDRNDARYRPLDPRQDQRVDRRDYRRDDRRDWRQDQRVDRRDYRATNDNRWDNNQRRAYAEPYRDRDNWNSAPRYDDRTRWTNQRRWNNDWRRDSRYDWSSYRSRYSDHYRAGRYYAPRGWNYGYRRFSTGIFLSSLLYSNSYWLNDPYNYRLPPAYGTLRWVRYYGDALLVDVRDGYVVDVIHDFFR